MATGKPHDAIRELAGPPLCLRLYVAGSAPHSLRAQANLETICRRLPAELLQLEIVDVLQDPLRALQDGVLVTPTLFKLSPTPVAQIIGDLSDQDCVRDTLDLGRWER